MKKTVSILAIAALGFALVGTVACGGGEKPAPAPAEAPKVVEEKPTEVPAPAAPSTEAAPATGAPAAEAAPATGAPAAPAAK